MSRPRLSSVRPTVLLAVALSALVVPAEDAEAQFTAPCATGCVSTLVGTSLFFAMGTAVAVGRLQGGFSTTGGGVATWASGFASFAVAGVALSGNGGRQERAIYAAGLGTIGGGLVGLAVESLIGENDRTSRLAATLVGAAAGALMGGAVGAITYEDDSSNPIELAQRATVLTFKLGF